MRAGPERADLGAGRPRRRRRWAAAATAALATAIVAGFLISGVASRHPSVRSKPIQPAAASPPAKPPPSSREFGVSVNRLFNDRAFTQKQIDAQLQALRRTGVSIARSDALWELTEVQPPIGGVHRYDWGFDDTVAGSLAAEGLRWLPIIDYSAGWAESIPGVGHSPPVWASAYAAYAAAFAARYGRGGSFWSTHPGLAPLPVDTYEIWNEPDSTRFWSPTPNPTRYAELYLRARNAIVDVDSSARVIVGGLTNIVGFLPVMLAARPDLRGHIDGVAIHPYGPNPQAVLARVRAAQGVLRSLDLGAVPLYVTEFGWATHPAGARYWLPEPLRALFISRTVAELGHVDCTLAAIVLYTWVTPERNPAQREDWFGIHPPSGQTSLDAAAFASGVRRAAARGARISLCSA
jgi:polysaccharide biosynthesis protein PslG